MRALELAKVAAAAEALRLRRLARRQAIRLALAVVAVVFLIAAFAFLHVVACLALANFMALWLAALIVLIVDLVIAGALLMVALRSEPDRIEREAMEVRHEALRGAKQAVTAVSVGAELAGFAFRRKTRQVIRGPGVGRWLAVADLTARLLRRR